MHSFAPYRSCVKWKPAHLPEHKLVHDATDKKCGAHSCSTAPEGPWGLGRPGIEDQPTYNSFARHPFILRGPQRGRLVRARLCWHSVWGWDEAAAAPRTATGQGTAGTFPGGDVQGTLPFPRGSLCLPLPVLAPLSALPHHCLIPLTQLSKASVVTVHPHKKGLAINV